MSRFNPHHSTEKLYQKVELWVERCLLGTGSMFAPDKQLWTPTNLDQLDLHYVQNLDEGDGNFLDKLQSQLSGATADSKKLMAEIMWLLMLFPSNISTTQKRHNVREIWAWSGEELPAAHPELADDVLEGIGSTGIGFNNHRWRELVFIIGALRTWKALAPNTQEELAADGWRFLGWLETQTGADRRQLTHILPHLIFPDLFERISSSGDKIKILEAMHAEEPKLWKRESQEAVDKALAKLRARLEKELGRQIDFYDEDIKPSWFVERRAKIEPRLSEENAASFAETFDEFVQAYGEARNGPFTTVGRVSAAMSSLRLWLENSAPVVSREMVKVKISVGQGNWTRTPWIALLDGRVTTSTQRGFYIVFLVSDDLSVTYLTLNQGMTELVARLGQQGATEEMLRFAEAARTQLSGSLPEGFQLDNAIDLQAQTNAAANYEVGTIAHKTYETGSLPNDKEVSADLEQLLAAYEQLIENKTESPPMAEAPAVPYGVDDALEELFLDRSEVEDLLSIWGGKKNLILQGAPGVGKSFISRRLAYCLLGEKAPERVRSVQFHQSYSYEDFVRGFRPDGDGGFSLQDGIFFEFCRRAAEDPERNYVLLIDEINRGNLSKILGELMLLIEPDKRESPSSNKKEWTVRLAYSHPNEEEFWVPDNLFILGMMNTADRSLSLVDYALRRRFAFADLTPKFGSQGFHDVLTAGGVPAERVNRIVKRMSELNAEIEADKVNLGPGFCIGHSFFVPQTAVEGDQTWYERIVRTEIHPLLKEYWFDEPVKADLWRDKLLAR